MPMDEEYIPRNLSDYLIFAQTILGEMSPELQAKLNPTVQRPQPTPEIFQKYLRRCHYQYEKDEGTLSEEDYQNVEQLLKRMLAWEAKDRITAKDALALPLFSAERR